MGCVMEICGKAQVVMLIMESGWQDSGGSVGCVVES